MKASRVSAQDVGASSAAVDVDVDRALEDVRELVAASGRQADERWQAAAGRYGRGTLGGGSIPDRLMSAMAGGKELRPVLCIWGYVAAGGRLGTDRYGTMVTAAAALEWFHLFALVHDDVMDEAATRRGNDTVHVWASELHRRAGARGSAERFGDSIAVLAGDLALSLSLQLVATLPPELADLWHTLAVELYAGQSLDLICAADGTADQADVDLVAWLKTISYSVHRPLQLGALAAGATSGELATLQAYAEHVGQAFALRDDYLGVWGDPAETGKSNASDLAQGKATSIVRLGRQLLGEDDRLLLERVLTGAAPDGEVQRLARALEAAGVRSTVDRRIEVQHAAALAALDRGDLTPTGASGPSIGPSWCSTLTWRRPRRRRPWR